MIVCEKEAKIAIKQLCEIRDRRLIPRVQKYLKDRNPKDLEDAHKALKETVEVRVKIRY